MRELFIYYRVRQLHRDAAQTEVRRFQAGLRAHHPALRARLLRRPAEIDGLQTWMETYALDDAPGGISKTVQAEIAHAAEALARWIDGARHIEVFEPL